MNPGTLTLGDQLRETASAVGDKIAVIGAERTLTWAELRNEVSRVAALLADMGISRGDAVGLCTSKRPEVVVAFLALAQLGAIAAPVNHKLESSRIYDQFVTQKLVGVILEHHLDSVILPVAKRVEDRVLYVSKRGTLPGRLWRESDQLAGLETEAGEPDLPCYYNGTSGTTGRPKGAVASHANILWNAYSGVEGLQFGADEVFLCMFSVFSHPHELFHRALLTGAACVVVETLSPRVVAELVATHRVTWMMAVPSFYEMMLDHVGPEHHDVSSLRVLEAGGAWVSPDTSARLEERYGCGFMPVWGSTEANGVALALPPDGERVLGATGRIVATYEAEVRDAKGRPVPDDEQGELWIRGPSVASGYVGMPDETADAFRDGWYRTGDLVRRSADGHFWFVGRRADMLKVGGIRVYPLEIEQALARHPGIAEAVVVRSEERVRGEVPRAVIRLQEGVELRPSDIRAWCRTHLANYKIPRFVEFWDAIPRLPNGKVDRIRIAQTPRPT